LNGATLSSTGLAGLGERWQRLPRDTRDTLFQLAVIAWAVAPQLLHRPVWCALLTLALLGWRATLAWRGGKLPSRWLVAGILVLAGTLTAWQERTLLGKEAGITLLVVLVALKTLELRARRDALVVFFLGFFLVLTQFLYSQTLLTGLWLLLAVWGLLTALALAHMPVGKPPLKRAAAVAARAALLGIPVMAVLFVLFPRIGPLWGLPQDAVGRTGLSGSLRMGGVASIAEDDSIALRVRFEGAAPPQHQLYFRGPVLSRFDGREWTRLVPSFPAPQRPRLDLQVSGTPLRYEMTLEPSQLPLLPLLPLLEMTPDLPGAAPAIPGWLIVQRPDGQWQTDRPLVERQRITATAFLAHRHGPRQDVLGLRDLVDLPPNTNPRTLQWAAELRARPELHNADGLALAQAVLAHIGTGGFSYTLEPGAYSGDNTIDEFWFDRKLGFCEHFASAFVVIMRALDVPARIVTGFQGADPVLQDGWLVVRNSNAHAWAEIWLPERGWQRVDPTAAVAPDRISRSQRLAPPPGLVASAVNTLNPQLSAQLRAAWETLNNRWNQWVLNYSRGQQFDLLRQLGIQSPDWTDLASVLIAILCSAALGGAGWAWWDRYRQDPWQRLQLRVQQALARRGVEVQAHHGPGERARRVRAALGQDGAALADALQQLERDRYASDAALPRAALRRWWREFQMVSSPR
jgi:protein-glutamine gamma-glutamyltransferase